MAYMFLWSELNLVNQRLGELKKSFQVDLKHFPYHISARRIRQTIANSVNNGISKIQPSISQM